MVSGEPVEGDLYLKRIGDGVLGDGFNSALASVFNTFPNTTFSQNNGIIQLTYRFSLCGALHCRSFGAFGIVPSYRWSFPSDA